MKELEICAFFPNPIDFVFIFSTVRVCQAIGSLAANEYSLIIFRFDPYCAFEIQIEWRNATSDRAQS